MSTLPSGHVHEPPVSRWNSCHSLVTVPFVTVPLEAGGIARFRNNALPLPSGAGLVIVTPEGGVTWIEPSCWPFWPLVSL